MSLFDAITNSGQMAIGGGDAKSGAGDLTFDASAGFGGLNYGSTGISPVTAGFMALAVLGAVYYLTKKG
ncbi:MAG: hypothetical protein MJK12_12415 [Colwellia sp.]|nr:hypothetical protein [Colwellia sp.]